MYTGIWSSVLQDKVEAAELFNKACNGGDMDGCTNLGFMYEKGDGVRQNTSRAKELYGKACDLRFEEGCKAFARLNRQ